MAAANSQAIDAHHVSKQIGRLAFPKITNTAGWASTFVHVAQVANGEGPTVLVLAGSHGDEYEGQVAALRLLQELQPEQVHGRVIVIPVLSPAASKANTRNWPSGANFNRSFPGNPEGPPNERLAHYLTTVLFPQADVVIYMHSGGRSAWFLPCSHMHVVDDPVQRKAMLEGMEAWLSDWHYLYIETTYAAPRLGVRLRVASGLYLEASGGRYHRSPGFLELFGDGGSIAGSSDLESETGVNRDLGLEFDRVLGGLQIGGEVAHFRNRADHLITFLPQSQRTFVARNIGSARLEGEEVLWRLAAAGPQPRWRVDGHDTRLRTEDLGVDIRWYAGKALPGRPQHSVYSRVALRLGRVTVGYDYRFLGENFLDRWNRDRVARRDLHGIDLGVQARALQLRLAIRNLTDDQTRDVAGFPVAGRTLALGSEVHF